MYCLNLGETNAELEICKANIQKYATEMADLQFKVNEFSEKCHNVEIGRF